MGFKGVIFDLDGTLLNTLADIGNSMNHVLKMRGYSTHDLDKYRVFVGSGTETLVRRSLPEEYRNSKTIESCLSQFREVYEKNWNNMTVPYNGIIEMLKDLQALGIRLSILSNKPQDFTLKAASTFLSGINFECVAGNCPGIPLKPDPTGVLAVASTMRLDRDEILYVGDTDVDMQTASRAGMYSAGVLWGFRGGEELKKNNAKILVRDPRELITIVD